MVKTLVFGTVLAERVTVFVWLPGLPWLLKRTVMVPSSPGAMGSLEYSGTVHPQEP